MTSPADTRSARHLAEAARFDAHAAECRRLGVTDADSVRMRDRHIRAAEGTR